MVNPCDLVFARTPRTPSLKEGGDLLIETTPAVGPAVPVPVTGADAVLPLANPLAAAASDLEHMRGEPDVASELVRTLPAMAQRVLDLIAKSGPALDEALSVMAGKPTPESRFQPAGGRLGRAAVGDDPGRPARKQAPALPPQSLVPMQPVMDLVPPIEKVTIDLEKLSELSGPPPSKPLAEARQEALSTPWTAHEGERLRQEAPAAVTPVQVQVALRHLPELEALSGGDFRLASHRSVRGFAAAGRDAFRRLAAMGTSEQPGPVGAYLVALHDVYRAYKQDYHGLLRARRALLDRRDPASLLPILSEEELEDYLWRKYGKALRSRLWRLLRTSSDLPRKVLLGSDRPWQSGVEPARELLRSGVFVALRSDEGDFELQKEQGNPWSAQGTFNLAVAIRMGQDVVAYDVRSGVLKINGRVVPWSNGVYELPEGARLDLADERLQVISLRGDTVEVRVMGRTLVLSGRVSGDRPVDSVQGALGTFGAEGRPLEDEEAFFARWQVPGPERLL